MNFGMKPNRISINLMKSFSDAKFWGFFVSAMSTTSRRRRQRRRHNDASVSTTTDDPSAKTLSVLKTFLNRKFEEEMSYKTIFDFCISDF